MTSLPVGISTIIFDLGGVIVDLEIEKTANAFAALSNTSLDEVFHAYQANIEFNAFEKGEINSAEFRSAARRIFSVSASDNEIDLCWNAMLIDLPKNKLVKLEKLMNHFSTLLLSNTNDIHLSYIEKEMLAGGSLDKFFHKAYYSHTLGMRKPDAIIFEHLLHKHNLIPAKTVFLDDNKENIEAAKQLGIQTIHITHPDLFFDLFKKYD
jgi:epoxide hydrolase-like predicted phosphatase